MRENCGSRLRQHHLPWKSPNLKFRSTVPYMGQQKFIQPFTNPYACMASANGSFAGLADSGLSHLKKSQGNEEKRWFYCFPRHCETGIPILNTVLKEKLSTSHHGCGVETTSNALPGSVQKRFLVFDQSGNQTNLIFNSLIGSPTQHLNPVNTSPINPNVSCQEESGTKKDLTDHASPAINDGLDENQKTEEGSETHEDTEELDALLYSDDSDYDTEETSTAHSPSDNTRCKKQEEDEGTADEVTSAIGGTKRKRLAEEDELSVLMDTASSAKPNKSSECEDDAESSFVKDRTQEKPSPLAAHKRLKRERIWETVSILQSIIPGGKDKDTAFVLDEAIKYLRFLKLKAKSLGVTME